MDQISEGPLAFFIFGVTIVVVAVPEGLPLAVTISLAYRSVTVTASSTARLACQRNAAKTSSVQNSNTSGRGRQF